MEIKRIGLINIGGNTATGPNRGPIFHDGSFVYVPIPQNIDREEPVSFRFPTYKDLGLEKYVNTKFHDQFVHLDPNFDSFTYGHAERGFGYETVLSTLKHGDILAFYATLDYKDRLGLQPEWIDPVWGTYIIGAFFIEGIYNQDTFFQLSYNRRIKFLENPHYYKRNFGAHFWIAGMSDSPGLFNIAFPLHKPTNREKGNIFLKLHFQTSSGSIAGDKGYYRTAFICKKNTPEVWKEIMEHSFHSNHL